jgi:hypothetical protein
MKSSNALNELANLKLQNLESVRRFDALLAEVAGHHEPESLPLLFRLFDDNTEHHEVMFGLVHLVERFELSQYVAALWGASLEMAQSRMVWDFIDPRHKRCSASCGTRGYCR